jgi:hypothetical protein
VPGLIAGGGPENVAVVVNADSFASLAVANAFVAARKVPAGNLVYLALGDLPDFETVDVATFRERILRPAFEALETRGVAAQIDYLVYSSDIPYAIRVSGDVGDRELPKELTEMASVNGLTYLFPLVLAEKPEYLSLGSNFYARLPVQFAIADQQTWTDEQRQLYQQADPADARKAVRRSGSILGRAGRSPPSRRASLVQPGVCLGSSGPSGRGDRSVETSRRDRLDGCRHMQADEELATLRNRDDFQTLVRRLEELSPRLRPTMGFSSLIGWNPAGQPGPPAAGMRYLLSTMLSVTSGRGMSVSEAISQLERSAAADSTFPPRNRLPDGE